MGSFLVPILLAVAAVALALVLRPQPLIAVVVLAVGLGLAFVTLQQGAATSSSQLPLRGDDAPPSSPTEPVPSDGGRWRLEVTVAIDGRPVTGSVVQEFRLKQNLFPGGSVGEFDVQLRAQALVLPLPGRPTLLALLRGEKAGLFPFGCVERGKDEAASLYLDRIRSFRGTCHLSEATGYPLLASLNEASDPHTFKLADRGNLSANFGPGVSLVGAQYVSTDEPVTTGIGEKLRWLDNRLEGLDFISGLFPRNHFDPRSLFRDGVR